MKWTEETACVGMVRLSDGGIGRVDNIAAWRVRPHPVELYFVNLSLLCMGYLPLRGRGYKAVPGITEILAPGVREDPRTWKPPGEKASEPVTVERVVYAYQDYGGYIVIHHSMHHSVASKKVTFTVGEFVDEEPTT